VRLFSRKYAADIKLFDHNLDPGNNLSISVADMKQEA